MNAPARQRVLREHGADGDQVAALLAYNTPHFQPPDEAEQLPLADEPCVDAWRGYAAEAAAGPILPVLARHLVQLRFPVRAGTSADEDYRAATRRGVDPDTLAAATGLPLRSCDAITLRFEPTAAGSLPVLVIPEREDFTTLVQALCHRNEPIAVPSAQGAAIVAGLNNWSRINAYRSEIEASQGAAAWPEAFAAFRSDKARYQDVVVLCSVGPYSGVSAARVDCAEAEWIEHSTALRIAHEATHYLTRRLLGSMKNRLHDELLADYAGIVAATDRYRPEWFLAFLGCDNAAGEGPRAGGRLPRYRGEPPLDDGALRILSDLARSCAATVERVDAAWHQYGASRVAAIVLALASVPLETIANANKDADTFATLQQLIATYRSRLGNG